MSVQELCLIPKSIVEKIIPSKPLIANDTSDNIKILAERTNIFPSKNHKSDLTLEISKIFTSENKSQKALNVYSWMVNNTPDIEISANGQLIKPLKQINIFEFIKDIYSATKKFNRDKLELYKIFIAWIDLPSTFIDNITIKNYAFSEIKNKNQGTKRKLPFSNARNVKVKKNDAETDTDDREDSNITDEGETSPVSIPEFNKLLKDVKSSPYLTRHQKLQLGDDKTGAGNTFHATKCPGPSLKWIKY